MGVNDMLRVPAKALTNYKLLYPVAATQQVSRRQEITFKRVSRQEGKVGERGFESTPWKVCPRFLAFRSYMVTRFDVVVRYLMTRPCDLEKYYTLVSQTQAFSRTSERFFFKVIMSAISISFSKGFYGQEGRGMINVNKGINNEGEALEDPTHDTMGEVQVDASEERDELNLPKISSYN
ncbi:uncharacterized protein HKW66_Vig0171970 [Vigna angularis]|uniref:Uncharacterized protein n=1 Tax=Phaseolus angularis TaxID=3914 RepID=A0A8T0JQA1_PHAAN|nr:uncharacterized protein HKW66_Vig0171970 [Vigna angularis]